MIANTLMTSLAAKHIHFSVQNPTEYSTAWSREASLNTIMPIMPTRRATSGRGVNLYVFHVSLTDFHCFDWLTSVRGNPYGFIKKKKFFFFFKLLFLKLFCCNPRDLHELNIKMAFVETCLP